ncbi:hypothetical protein ACM16X_20985 [Haloarcula japonica]|uniref:hypothetical protein n=1 Tax=Haloarcula japonica TaxID=29282 RepID=UPI0039F6A5DB
MDIQITFRDGPIEAEVSATEDEQYTEVLDALAEFVEEYDAVGPSEPQETIDSPTDSGTVDATTSARQAAEAETVESNTLFNEVDATDAELQRVLKTGRVEDGDVEQFPEIIGNTDVLGTSVAERLLNGATVILTILEDAHDVSRVRTTDLKDALGESGLNEDNWPNVHQQENKDVYLDSRGTGSSGTTTVRAPGKQDAYGHIQALVDDLREDGENDD